jgi:hypothetical protein
MTGGIRRYWIRMEVPPSTNQYMYFEIDYDAGTWAQIKPYHPCRNNYLAGAIGTMKWDWGSDQVWLRDRYDRNRFLLNGMQRAGTIGQSGPAFFGFNLGKGREDWRTSWVSCAKPQQRSVTGAWIGLAGKGGGELVVGADAAPSCVFSLDNPRNGMSFIAYSGRAGIAGGLGGCVSVCLVTNVTSPASLNGFAYSGTDWALSLGAPLKKVATAVREFAVLLEAAKAARFAKVAETAFTHADAVVNLGKLLLYNSNIDTEETSVNLIDLPGPGVELGYYWYWSQVRGCFGWTGAPVMPKDPNAR